MNTANNKTLEAMQQNLDYIVVHKKRASFIFLIAPCNIGRF